MVAAARSARREPGLPARRCSSSALLAIVLGVRAPRAARRTRAAARVGFAVGALFVALGVGPPLSPEASRVARKLPQLQRVLDAPALASVAYGEIASSIYFALGIIALHALGLTPVVLGVVGVLFLIVALSYAEGTAAIRETGGAATFVRVAFNDFAGFLTGWALFLDYLIVIALSALFVPHYLGLALGIDAIATQPGRRDRGVRRDRAHRRRPPHPADALYTSGSRRRCSTSSRSCCSSCSGSSLLFSRAR